MPLADAKTPKKSITIDDEDKVDKQLAGYGFPTKTVNNLIHNSFETCDKVRPPPCASIVGSMYSKLVLQCEQVI
jgi:hypothetical protein